MGNNSVSTKFTVLTMLRAAGGSPVSGQTLADELGISRVSIWKAVQSLQESGYGIISEGKGPSAGYSLIADTADSLYPWEFAEMQTQFKHFKSTTSTMDEARVLAAHDSIVSIVTADEQTNGRGRLNHQWISTSDSLSFTLITKPVSPLGYYNRFCALSQIALVHVFEGYTGRKFFVRWPNDVWSQEGKAAGILTDVQGTGDMLSWVNLGVGINIAEKPCVEKSDAVFPKGSRKQVTRKKILMDFLFEFRKLERELERDPAMLVRLWNDLCPDIGKDMHLKNSGEHRVFKGITNWAWAQCEDYIFPPGDISFLK